MASKQNGKEDGHQATPFVVVEDEVREEPRVPRSASATVQENTTHLHDEADSAYSRWKKAHPDFKHPGDFEVPEWGEERPSPWYVRWTDKTFTFLGRRVEKGDKNIRNVSRQMKQDVTFMGLCINWFSAWTDYWMFALFLGVTFPFFGIWAVIVAFFPAILWRFGKNIPMALVCWCLGAVGLNGAVWFLIAWTFFVTAISGLFTYAFTSRPTPERGVSSSKVETPKEVSQGLGTAIGGAFDTAWKMTSWFVPGVSARNLAYLRNMVGLIKDLPQLAYGVAAFWKGFTFNVKDHEVEAAHAFYVLTKDVKYRVVNASASMTMGDLQMPGFITVYENVDGGKSEWKALDVKGIEAVEWRHMPENTVNVDVNIWTLDQEGRRDQSISKMLKTKVEATATWDQYKRQLTFAHTEEVDTPLQPIAFRKPSDAKEVKRERKKALAIEKKARERLQGAKDNLKDLRQSHADRRTIRAAKKVKRNAIMALQKAAFGVSLLDVRVRDAKNAKRFQNDPGAATSGLQTKKSKDRKPFTFSAPPTPVPNRIPSESWFSDDVFAGKEKEKEKDEPKNSTGDPPLPKELEDLESEMLIHASMLAESEGENPPDASGDLVPSERGSSVFQQIADLVVDEEEKKQIETNQAGRFDCCHSLGTTLRQWLNSGAVWIKFYWPWLVFGGLILLLGLGALAYFVRRRREKPQGAPAPTKNVNILKYDVQPGDEIQKFEIRDPDGTRRFFGYDPTLFQTLAKGKKPGELIDVPVVFKEGGAKTITVVVGPHENFQALPGSIVDVKPIPKSHEFASTKRRGERKLRRDQRQLQKRQAKLRVIANDEEKSLELVENEQAWHVVKTVVDFGIPKVLHYHREAKSGEPEWASSSTIVDAISRTPPVDEGTSQGVPTEEIRAQIAALPPLQQQEIAAQVLKETAQAFKDVNVAKPLYIIRQKNIFAGAVLNTQKGLLMPNHFVNPAFNEDNMMSQLAHGEQVMLENAKAVCAPQRITWERNRAVAIPDADDAALVPLARPMAHLPRIPRMGVLPEGTYRLWLTGVNPTTCQVFQRMVTANKVGNVLKYIADNKDGICSAMLTLDTEADVLVGFHVRGNPSGKTCTATAVTNEMARMCGYTKHVLVEGAPGEVFGPAF